MQRMCCSLPPVRPYATHPDTPTAVGGSHVIPRANKYQNTLNLLNYEYRLVTHVTEWSITCKAKRNNATCKNVKFREIKFTHFGVEN